MYIPGLFKITDSETIHEFIRDNGFGMLVTTINGKLEGTHIPMYLILPIIVGGK